MIKRFLKTSQKFFTFLVITGILFSNVPYNVFTSLIDSYENTNGIVDKIWKLEQSHKDEIVDNFSSIRNIADKLRVHEVSAAVSIRNVGAYTNGTANLVPAIPAGAVAGDMMLLIYGTKPYNDAPTINNGWTSIGSATDGVVVAGVDVGSMQTRIYYKEHTGSETAPTVTNGTNNVSGAVIVAFQKGASEVWETPVGAGGGDATAGTGFSVTASSNPGITAGDMLVGYAAIRSDAGAQSTIGITATGLTLGAFTEYPAADLITTAGGDMAMSGGYRLVTAGTASAAPVYTSTLAAAHTGSAFMVRLRATAASYTTTISNFVGGETANSTIAPGASGNVDSFGLVASGGSTTVTAASVGLAAGMGQYVQTVAITNDAGGTTYCSGAPSGDTASLTSCTIPVTVTNTQFKIKITADPHTSMPVPSGGNYGVTGIVTSWTDGNAAHAGTDSGSGTLTIDNLSPAATTGASATPGDTSIDIGWTDPGDADFQQVYIYCKTSAITEVPTEGTDPAVDATACDATARMKWKGVDTSSPQIFSGLTNGQIYYFRIYTRDTNGNFTAYASTQQVSATPVPAGATITMSNFVASEPGNFTIAPGASAQVDSFGIVASAGTDTLTDAVVTMTTGMGQYISNVALTNNGDTVTYCNATPSGDTATFTGCTLPVTVTNTQFKVRLTAKSHALMPAPSGGSYAIGATVTSFTVTGTEAGSDAGSSTTTIDNLSPNGATSVGGTAGNSYNNLYWTSSSSLDYDSTNGSVVLRWASGTEGAEVPAEGNSSYTAGNIIGTATVACAISQIGFDGVSETDGTGGSVGCNTSALTNGQAYTYKVFQRDTKGNYDAGISIGTFTPSSPAPTITTYTNTTETALNYANCGTTGCGARIGGGAIYRQSITITGTNLGTVTAGNRSTATNNIKVGTHQIADANITDWTPASITFLTDTTQTGDADADWGVNFGGATALTVTANSTTTTGLNFYIFPQVTGLRPCSNFSLGDWAREYNASDSACPNGLTDGEIFIDGTRFGSGAGSGSVTIIGQTATTTAWSNTSITAQVPVTIADTTNTGNLLMTQGTDSNGKTYTYTTTGFRVLPRITSLSPNSGIVNTAVTVNGNHFCQTGTCPTGFTAADKVTFTSAITATLFTSWSATAIVTAVPTGAATGNVFVTSNTSYTSNNLTFTVAANTTTLATGSDGAAATIAPGVSATDVNTFTLQTNGGTESISSVTVNLSTNSGVGTIAITDNANTVLGSLGGGIGTGISTGSNVITVAGLSATTSLVTYKVRVTPLIHTGMPAPAGAAYAITAPVTAWAGSNTHTGSDTNTNALTIDNLSPSNATVVSGTSGDTQVVLNWTNPGDSDFHSTIVLRRETTAVGDTPVEGTTYIVGNTIGSSTVACVVASPTATCTDSGLINGTVYHYKIFTKDSRVNYSATGVVPTGSPFTPTLTQTLTVGTVGTQATNLNSGSASQHIGGGTTAAFTLQINTSTSNVTSVKISDTGTVAIANLSNPKLYYENAANAAACAYGGAESSVSGAAPAGETITFTLPTVAIGVSASVTCLYFVSDIGSVASGGQTIDLQITNPSTDVSISSGVNTDTVAKTISGTTTIKPQITGYTNTTEGALDYGASCSTCGARIGGGAGFRQSITIGGYGFGTDPGAANRSTATNNIKVGTHQIASANVTAWSATSITFLTDTAQTGDADADWGTNFGGASALTVTANSTTTTGLNFYLFPQVTGLRPCNNLTLGDWAREYNASDSACPNGLTDGEIFIDGTRFGSSAGSGSVTIVGQTATTTSWSNTSITAQVPATIADTTNTGNLLMTQGTDSNGKAYTYTTTGFRVLPRITSLVPSSASALEAITLNGNHLCQTGTCPTIFGASNKVTFTTATDATTFTSWSHTAMVTAVPTGAIDGNVILTSNSYTSNGSMFSIVSSIPDDPTSMGQYEDVGFTQSIATGDMAALPIYLKMSMRVDPTSSTLYPQVEYKPVGTAFTCSGTAVCADAVEGTGVASPGPTNGYVSVLPTDGSYHWQARVKHTRNAVDYYSNWVSYGGNAEDAADFIVDTTGPVITSISSGTPGTNGATISWSTGGELSTSQVQWNTTGIFVDNCATNNDCTIIEDVSPMVNSHSVSISNLNSGTLYYYRVRSKDGANNETISANNSFTTQIVDNPQKTIKSFINGAEGSISSATTYYFTVDAPEIAADVKNAYIEVIGLVSGGFGGTITINSNSVGARSYEVSTGSGIPTLYKFVYQISLPNLETNLNLNDSGVCTNGNPSGTPPCNKVIITPSMGSINVLSAKIVTTYSYTP